MKIDAIVWQAGKALQDVEGLKRYASTPQDGTAGTLACLPALVQTCIEDVKDAFVAVQNRTDTDAARWLLSNVGDWLSATMEGNGAASWLNDYKQLAQAARETEKETYDYFAPIAFVDTYANQAPYSPAVESMEKAEKAANAWDWDLAAIQETQTALDTLCALLRDLQEWTAIQSTAPQSTCTPPQEEGTQLPTIMGTQREEDYYRRAIERGYMERQGDGYQWKHPQVCWGYFMQLCYKYSDRYDAAFKEQAARLFGFPRPERIFETLASVKKPQRWRAQMDKAFADLQPYASE